MQILPVVPNPTATFLQCPIPVAAMPNFRTRPTSLWKRNVLVRRGLPHCFRCHQPRLRTQDWRSAPGGAVTAMKDQG